MANNKNSTRKRKKKTYRKKYRKTATKHMMMGGNPFSSLFTGIKSSFSIFRSKAKEEAAKSYNDTKAKAEGRITEVKTTLKNTQDSVNKKAECVAACAKI